MTFTPFLELQNQVKKLGYSRKWKKITALVFHSTKDGKLIWPFQSCEYRWDGSGYDPGYEFRFIQPHIHYYCYRSRNCTLCGEYCSGPEPEYTPHLIINNKPFPAVEINEKLIPKEI